MDDKKVNIKNKKKYKKTMKKECPICAEEYTHTKMVTCGSCNFEACRKCNQTYLLGITNLSNCMNCKNKWNLEFCLDNLTKTFVRKTYKDHRKKLLFETEKSRFPETMPLVENYLNLSKYEKEHREILDKEWELKKQLRKIRQEKSKCIEKIYNCRNGVLDKQDKKVFSRPCPVDKCRGYLSSAWKCGICETYVCSRCFEIKGKRNDEYHVCDENNVKAADLIKKETKPCPSCSIAIYKISGCDQMWCTQCKIPFSWKTGKKVHGVIHNPHFYQWQKQNNNNIRNVNEVHCGGIPGYHELRRRVQVAGPGMTNRILFESWRHDPKNLSLREKGMLRRCDILYEMHRALRHLLDMELNPLRADCNRLQDNIQLRIKFLAKEIDEKKMKTSLIRKDNSRNKKLAIIHVYELLNIVWTESFLDIFNNLTAENFDRNLKRMNQVTILANQELIKISMMYNQVVNVFGENFMITRDSPKKFFKNLKTEVKSYVHKPIEIIE